MAADWSKLHLSPEQRQWLRKNYTDRELPPRFGNTAQGILATLAQALPEPVYGAKVQLAFTEADLEEALGMLAERNPIRQALASLRYIRSTWEEVDPDGI